MDVPLIPKLQAPLEGVFFGKYFWLLAVSYQQKPKKLTAFNFSKQ
jgi:hypothetical protein